MTNVDRAVSEIMDTITPAKPEPIITFGKPRIPPRDSGRGYQSNNAILKATRRMLQERQPGAQVRFHDVKSAATQVSNFYRANKRENLPVTVKRRGSMVYIEPTKGGAK